MGNDFCYNRPWNPQLGQAPEWLSWLKLFGHLEFGARRHIHLTSGLQEASVRDVAGAVSLYGSLQALNYPICVVRQVVIKQNEVYFFRQFVGISKGHLKCS
jgi:hypothetical protein